MISCKNVHFIMAMSRIVYLVFFYIKCQAKVTFYEELPYYTFFNSAQRFKGINTAWGHGLNDIKLTFKPSIKPLKVVVPMKQKRCWFEAWFKADLNHLQTYHQTTL